MKTQAATRWGLMTALFAMTVLPVDMAFAGRRDWARAGRILTGYVLVRTLVGDPFQAICRRHDRVAAHGARYACGAACGPAVYAAPTRIRVRTSVRRAPPPGDPPQRWIDRGFAAAPVPVKFGEVEPLIVPLRDGRRLYQPGPAGSTAYVQCWSAADETWTSVARMPCLR